MTALLLCGGTILDYEGCRSVISQYDYVICADSGAKHLAELNLKPDILMGDFDSIDRDLLQIIKNNGQTEIIPFNPEKDLTDAEIITNKAIRLGCDTLIYIGAWGSRMDHSLSNIMLAVGKAQQGLTCVMTDGSNTYYTVNKKIALDSRCKGKMISILPMTPVIKGVTTKGLAYPLHEATMYKDSTYGVSNFMKEEKAEITIGEGLAIVSISPDE